MAPASSWSHYTAIEMKRHIELKLNTHLNCMMFFLDVFHNVFYFDHSYKSHTSLLISLPFEPNERKITLGGCSTLSSSSHFSCSIEEKGEFFR